MGVCSLIVSEQINQSAPKLNVYTMRPERDFRKAKTLNYSPKLEYW
jgi:hypothetical protein